MRKRNGKETYCDKLMNVLVLRWTLVLVLWYSVKRFDVLIKYRMREQRYSIVCESVVEKKEKRKEEISLLIYAAVEENMACDPRYDGMKHYILVG